MAATSPYHEGVPVRLAEPAMLASGDIERRRFGRTEIAMPVFTCGGMRTQQGPHTDGMRPEDVEAECQQNLDDIVKRSLELGINHFETARVCEFVIVNSTRARNTEIMSPVAAELATCCTL
jgi:hypothetical protein